MGSYSLFDTKSNKPNSFFCTFHAYFQRNVKLLNIRITFFIRDSSINVILFNNKHMFFSFNYLYFHLFHFIYNISFYKKSFFIINIIRTSKKYIMIAILTFTIQLFHHDILNVYFLSTPFQN